MRILLTGASGFVGHHVLNYLLRETGHEVVCPVSWEHRGSQARWRWLMDTCADGLGRVELLRHDLRNAIDKETSRQIGHIDWIFNIASESHVDRSITDPVPFIHNNVQLMTTMLEFARERKSDLNLFMQMSTDEVYGPACAGQSHEEWSTILPSNPYSASKAAQEAIAISYWRTYGVPLVITNTMNIFGPRQDEEKFPAMVMAKVSRGETVPIHANADGSVIGSRYYLPAWNLANAWHWLADLYGYHPTAPVYDPDWRQGLQSPSRWNIVGQKEVDNLQFAQMIAQAMDKELKYELVDFHSSRPGHDLRYALDGSKLEDNGYRFPWSLKKGIDDMVRNYESVR